MDGYDPSYYTDKIQLLLTKCVVDDTEVSVAPVDWEKASVTIFNRKRPELPKTGVLAYQCKCGKLNCHK